MAPARHKWIAADPFDFFKILLSKLTKIWQCIQTIKDVALFLNFSARSAVSKKVLFLQRTPRGKQKRSSRSISLRDTLLHPEFILVFKEQKMTAFRLRVTEKRACEILYSNIDLISISVQETWYGAAAGCSCVDSRGN